MLGGLTVEPEHSRTRETWGAASSHSLWAQFHLLSSLMTWVPSLSGSKSATHSLSPSAGAATRGGRRSCPGRGAGPRGGRGAEAAGGGCIWVVPAEVATERLTEPACRPRLASPRMALPVPFAWCCFPPKWVEQGGSSHKVPTESPALSHREQAPMAVGHTEAAQASPAVPSSAGDLTGSQLHTGLRAGAALRLLPPQRPPQEYCRTLICFWFIYT